MPDGLRIPYHGMKVCVVSIHLSPDGENRTILVRLADLDPSGHTGYEQPSHTHGPLVQWTKHPLYVVEGQSPGKSQRIKKIVKKVA